eukprot:scaffold339569_cov31-Prasinocladus_malaysianus.AAC.1
MMAVLCTQLRAKESELQSLAQQLSGQAELQAQLERQEEALQRAEVELEAGQDELAAREATHKLEFDKRQSELRREEEAWNQRCEDAAAELGETQEALRVAEARLGQ